MLYPALLPLMRTPRLPVVDLTDAPVGVNGLVLFAERRNMVSARVPSHFKRSLQHFLQMGLLLTPLYINVFSRCYVSNIETKNNPGLGPFKGRQSGPCSQFRARNQLWSLSLCATRTSMVACVIIVRHSALTLTLLSHIAAKWVAILVWTL